MSGYRVTASFLLGMRAQFGRAITAADFEPGRTSVVVISHGFWQQRLGARSGVIGSQARKQPSETSLAAE